MIDIDSLTTGQKQCVYAAEILRVLQETGAKPSSEIQSIVQSNLDLPQSEYGKIAWGREFLKHQGYFDVELGRGIWGLTEKGKATNVTEDFWKEIHITHLEYQKQGLHAKQCECEEENPDPDDFDGIGIFYVLDTHTIDEDTGKKIIKLGQTQDFDKRISSLYNTSTPYEPTVLRKIETPYYKKVEQAAFKVFHKSRLNPNREFFTDDILPMLDQIIEIAS